MNRSTKTTEMELRRAGMPPANASDEEWRAWCEKTFQRAPRGWKGVAWRLRGTFLDGDYLSRPDAVAVRVVSPTIGRMARVTRSPRKELRARQIEAVLREDAERSPELAHARRAAVTALLEEVPDLVAFVTARTPPQRVRSALSIVEGLKGYERLRGDGEGPSPRAVAWWSMGDGWPRTALDAYERARTSAPARARL